MSHREVLPPLIGASNDWTRLRHSTAVVLLLELRMQTNALYHGNLVPAHAQFECLVWTNTGLFVNGVVVRREGLVNR